MTAIFPKCGHPKTPENLDRCYSLVRCKICHDRNRAKYQQARKLRRERLVKTNPKWSAALAEVWK